MAPKKNDEPKATISPNPKRLGTGRRKPALAGLISNRLLKAAQALPMAIDDAEQKYGLDLYDDMVNTSLAIDTAESFLTDRTFEEGIQYLPNVPAPLRGAKPTSPEAIEFANSLKCAAFINYIFEHLEDEGTDVNLLHRQMFSCVRYGRSLGEKTLDYLHGEWEGWIGLSAFRFIPRQNYAVIFDPYGKLLGAIGYKPGQPSPIVQGIIANPENWDNFVPADRLVFMVLKPSLKHPAGQSLYRSSYRDWWATRVVEPIELKSMAQWGGEGLLLVAGPDGLTDMDIKDEEGNVTRQINQIQYVLESMAEWQPNDIGVLPPGFGRIQIGGDGNAEGFCKFFDRHDRRLSARILYTATMLGEAERNSQAQADKSENITDTAVRSCRSLYSNSFRRQVVKQLIRINLGTEWAMKYTPIVAMAQMSVPDREKLLVAMSEALKNGAISYAMLPKLWRLWLGEDYLPDERKEEKPNEQPDDDEQTGSGGNAGFAVGLRAFLGKLGRSSSSRRAR